MKIKNLDKLLARLDDLSKKQLPAVVERSLNATVYKASVSLNKEIADSFDRPTPLVRRAVRYEKTGSSSFRARVFIPGEESSGPDLASILRPHITGEDRIVKNSERMRAKIKTSASPIDDHNHVYDV